MSMSNYKNFNRYSDSNKNVWIVNHLIWNARELPVFEYLIEDIPIDDKIFWKLDCLRDIVAHYEKINQANLDYPIIINAEGQIMDGWHRIAKAISENKLSVKAVKFLITPPPDYKDI
jgi:hypothetical protein